MSLFCFQIRYILYKTLKFTGKEVNYEKIKINHSIYNCIDCRFNACCKCFGGLYPRGLYSRL